MGTEGFPSKLLNLSIQLWHPEGSRTSVGCLGPSRRKCSLRRTLVGRNHGNQRKLQRGSLGHSLTQRRLLEILGWGRSFVMKWFLASATSIGAITIKINSHFEKGWWSLWCLEFSDEMTVTYHQKVELDVFPRLRWRSRGIPTGPLAAVALASGQTLPVHITCGTLCRQEIIFCGQELN